MILELAILQIKEGQSTAFEQSLEKAQAIISQAEGYLGHQFQQCIEEPHRYILLIRWESLEAHEEGFRKSELFKEWRGLIGSFFASPPVVQHYSMKFQNE